MRDLIFRVAQLISANGYSSIATQSRLPETAALQGGVSRSLPYEDSNLVDDQASSSAVQGRDPGQARRVPVTDTATGSGLDFTNQ